MLNVSCPPVRARASGDSTAPARLRRSGAGGECIQSIEIDFFERERAGLFRVAHRMLGCSAEAEDVLHDAFLRWDRLGSDRRDIREPGAYLTQVVTRLCLDILRSARKRRVLHVDGGPKDFEVGPLGAHDEADPFERLVLVDDAFEIMLACLNPAERAVLLLRESFDFGYAEIAPIVGKSEANCRQIDRRARRRLQDAPRVSRLVCREDRKRLRGHFLDATRNGKISVLVAFLSDEVASWTGRKASGHPEAPGLRRTA